MTTSASQDAQAAEQAAAERRRKRKERAAKSRAPEPKNIVSGAGQPLDAGVRRELEEQLGHDFSQVRLHTDRDAGALTDLLGADAVAVGKDIFFGEGAYRPGTDEGRRLLAHELLHTVQNPHGLGALRAGRDLGAVSLPQQAIEREAESAAQELVRPEQTRTEESAPEVEEGQATPGWLRYATVDADRNRAEQIDPSSLVDRLANDVVRSLRGDPEDLSKRTRRRLARLPEEFVDEVLVRLENRLLGSEHDRVLDFIEEIEAQGELGADSAEWTAQDAPAVEADTAGELRADRTAEQETAAELQAEEERPDAAPGPEKDRAVADGAQGSTPQNGGTPRSGSTPQGADAPRGGEEDQQEDQRERPGSATESGGGSQASEQGGGQGTKGADAPSQETSGGASKGGEQQQSQSGGKDSQQSGSEKGGADKGGSGKGGKDDAGKEEKAGEQGAEQPEQRAAAAESEEESAAKNRPGAADALAADQAKQEDKAGAKQPEGSPAAGRDTQLPGKTSKLDGVRNQDLLDEEERADEDPFGSGSASEVDAGGAEKSAWDTKLEPEDFLPEKDLDVSGVPTADKLGPGAGGAAQAPTFPAPPPTKADKVQAERDAEDAEDEQAEAEPDEAEAEGAAEPEPSVETEGSPESDERLSPEGADQRPGPGSPSKDPKEGDDPKAGPAAKQRAAQEAPGKTEGGGEAKEPAAKEEKGSPAAGDKAGAAAEKGSQQAAGGTAAASEQAGKGGEPKKDEQKNDGQQKSESDPASKGQAEQGGGDSAGQASDGKQQDDKSPSPARDSHVTGGSNGAEPGGASGSADSGAKSGADSGSGSGADSGTDSGAAQDSGGGKAEAKGEKETKASAPKAAPKESEPAPKDPPKSSAQETKARKEEPAAKDEPAAASPKAAPAPKAPGGGGGGGGAGAKGGGGGGKGKSKESPPAPNLSQVSPEAGLSSASKLKPHRALEAMGGVGGSVDRTVGDEHKKLSSAPPSVERPAGSPQTLEGKPKTDAPAKYNEDEAKKSDAPKDEKAEVKGAKNPEGQIEAEKMEEPGGWDTFMMGLGFVGGKLVNGIASVFGADKPVVDEQKLAAKFAGLPTGDEAMKEAKSGQAPGVEMKGAADDKADEQGEAVDSKGQEAVETGRDDAGRSAGEDQVYPDAPKEQLKAKVPGGEAGKGGVRTGKASTGAVPAEAASKVAEHDKKAEFQGAFSDGAKGVSEGRKTKDKGFREQDQKQKRQVKTEVAKSTREQADERAKAKSEVKTERGTWRKDQDEELKKLGTKKSERHKKARTKVEDEEKKTDEKAKTEEKENDGKIQKRGKEGEEEAKNHTKTAANESGNWVSKAFDWIKKKIIEIKDKIVKAIKAARKAIVDKIKEFKERVEGWINAARKAIVEAVKELIKDLIEFAKNLVKAIVDLAKRIWKLITDLVAAAIAFVTKLAAALKKAITDLLDRIAKALSSILSVLKKMLMDVVKAVVDAIKTVLEYASKLLGALGEFMMIAVDFMSDPGGWLSGAKNSAVDGAKNHLFREVKSAVKEWFQSKIEEIIGVPKAILDKLIKGGYSLEKIAKETWDAIVPMLPFIIGEIVITKVIAKLIPGAGWVMAVIDAIKTAIGALSEILRAIGAVIEWLKSVRRGGAGVLFAKAVAAGIVALLELAYEALLSGIGKYVSKVGRRLKGVAQKLGKDKGGNGDKGKDGQGDDDKGGDKGKKPGQDGKAGDKPKDSTESKDTPAKPSPSNMPPGKRPTSKPDPKKPTPPKDKDTKDDGKKDAPSKPGPGKKSDAPSKPGPDKKDNDKPDTRPTPSPKPKPKPEPPTKPKTEPTPGAKPKDDKGNSDKPKDQDSPTKPKDEAPDKPKDQDGPGKPKDQDGSGKPKDQDGSGKPKDKDAPGKPKDKDGDGTKPKNDKDSDKPGKPKDKDGPGKPKNKPGTKPGGRKGPGKTGPKPDKAGPGRPKSKEDKDKKKKEEDSQDSKNDRLRKIVARIRPRVESMLSKGVRKLTLKSTLTALKLWHRLSALEAENGQRFEIEARLNPKATVANGLEMETGELAEALDAMVDKIVKSNPPGTSATSNAWTGKSVSVDSDDSAFATLKGAMENPMPHRQPRTLSVGHSGGARTQMETQRSQAGGGGSQLFSPSGGRPSYKEEEKSLNAMESAGNPMGQLVLDSISGNRASWANGNWAPETLDQAVLTSTLLTLTESLRAPFVIAPNIGAVAASQPGGQRIGDVLSGLPLSGKAAISAAQKEEASKFGADSYQMLGGQAAGQQSHFMIDAGREVGIKSYRDPAALASGSSLQGYLRQPKSSGFPGSHPSPQLASLQYRHKIPAKYVRQAFDLTPSTARADDKMWKEINDRLSERGPYINPPSQASKEVLDRTAANIHMWANSMNLAYSSNDTDAKGKFLVRIYRELAAIAKVTPDPSYEQHIRKTAHA